MTPPPPHATPRPAAARRCRHDSEAACSRIARPLAVAAGAALAVAP